MQGYNVPPTTQYPGMYAPPMATPTAPPTQHPGMYTHSKATPPQSQPTEYTDQGPPKYSDLYKSHPPPPPMAPQQTAYTQSSPAPVPLPEEPSS